MAPHPRIHRLAAPDLAAIGLSGYHELVIDRHFHNHRLIHDHLRRTTCPQRRSMAVKVVPDPPDDNRALGVIVWALLSVALGCMAAAWLIGRVPL